MTRNYSDKYLNKGNLKTIKSGLRKVGGIEVKKVGVQDIPLLLIE